MKKTWPKLCSLTKFARPPRRSNSFRLIIIDPVVKSNPASIRYSQAKLRLPPRELNFTFYKLRKLESHTRPRTINPTYNEKILM